MKKLFIIALLALSITPVASAYVPVLGCTDSGAFNYNPLADTDDGSCVPVIKGCADPHFFNFNPEVNTPDNSCYAIGVSTHFSMPLINPFVAPIVEVNGHAVTIHWLTTKFMTGEVQYGKSSSPLTLGAEQTPVGANGWSLGASPVYSGSQEADNGSLATYHTATVIVAPGTWYLRPVSSIGDYTVYGQEIVVVVQ